MIHASSSDKDGEKFFYGRYNFGGKGQNVVSPKNIVDVESL